MRYNKYLLPLAVLVLFCGCSMLGPKKPKEAAILEFHLESTRDSMNDIQTVPINRSNPFYLNVSREAFLTTGDLEDAAVVDELGGFVIRLKFNSQGTQLLTTKTAGNPGKHIAILCLTDNSRWLAAPLIQRPIQDGVISFTPDATREESEKIVRGLKAVSKIVNKDSL